MIKVVVRKNGDKWIFDFNGHANFDKPGRDIVCASVSTLYQTLLMGLRIWRASFELGGNYKIVVKNNKNGLQNFLETILYSLKGVEKGYPRNLRVEVVEDGS